jgi:hypothetical protein
MVDEKCLKDWNALSVAEQSRLLDEFGHFQDELPRTCDLSQKIERLQTWLLGRGIKYSGEHKACSTNAR